jgi:RNA methyltransferase, TrmH family
MPSLIDELLRTQTRAGREQAGAFSLEGTRLVERALRAGAPLLRVGVDATRLAAPDPWLASVIDQALAAGHAVEPLDPDALKRFTGPRDLGGIAALAALPEMHPDHARLEAPEQRVLVLDQIHDPGNVGALVRTALASDVTAIVVCGGTDPLHPRAVRTSMGSLFRVPILAFTDADATHAWLERANVVSVATVTRDGTPLDALEVPDRVAVWMGSEAHGLAHAAEVRCPLRTTIPMASDVDSYSVNAAAAVVLYAVRSSHRRATRAE